MSPVNIRTTNGANHNGHLHPRYQRIQNRAAAVLDAWEEFGEALTIDVIAHMHSLKVNQIKKDLYGDVEDFQKRFGKNTPIKLERVLKHCMNEIKQGVDSTLVAVANHIPFKLIRDMENGQSLKKAARDFFLQMMTSNEKENNKNNADLDFSVDEVYEKKVESNRQCGFLLKNQDLERNISTIDTHDECNIESCCNTEPEEHPKSPSKRLKKHFHNVIPLEPHKLNKTWILTRITGVGLVNKNILKKCLNICYANSIIQCLANIASFAQWLLDDGIHITCN